jgi:bifunctional non-homologous end joining protein LigD
LSPVFEDGEALLAEVAERRLEGVVSKPKSSRYVDGHRGWVKVKLRNQQEFVVLGWTKGKGALEGVVGGLALGYRDGENWVYVGRAGTGPKEHERVMLLERLEGLEKGRPANVLTGNAANAEIQRIQWVKPEMVVEVAFQRWSPDGRLVIPSLKGVRDDKDAMDVGREP